MIAVLGRLVRPDLEGLLEQALLAVLAVLAVLVVLVVHVTCCTCHTVLVLLDEQSVQVNAANIIHISTRPSQSSSTFARIVDEK